MNQWLAKSLVESFEKHELYSYITKSESDDVYKKHAERGMALMYPVKIGGQTHNPKNGIGYHSTIKAFNPDHDSADQAHEIASKTPLRPPSAKHTNIEPITLKGRDGNTIYALALKGVHEQEAKNHNAKFKHMGFEQNYEFQPHISLDHETWDRIKGLGHKTAHDAGIEFGDAELRQGHTILANYPHQNQSASTGAIRAVREKTNTTVRPRVAKLGKSEVLEKGLMRNLGVSAAVTLAGCALAPKDHKPDAGSHQIQQTHHTDAYDHGKMLQAIAHVESTDGKFTNHKPTSQGTAYGKYALMPNTIRDTIHLNKDLATHKKALDYDDSGLANYLNANPGLEQSLADHHLNRLEQHFGHNRDAIGFAWNQGVTGAHKALKEKKDIQNHPYVEKIREAYRGV